MKLSPRVKEDLKIILLVGVFPLCVYGLTLLDEYIAENSGKYVVCSVDGIEKIEEDIEEKEIELDKSGELKFLHYVD